MANPGGAAVPPELRVERRTQGKKEAFPIGRGSMRQDGMRVRLTRLPGLTHRNLLRSPLFFQCPPIDQIERAKGHNSSTYSVYSRRANDGGEFVHLGGRKLRRITLSTLWVAGRPSFGIAPNQHNNELIGLDYDDLVRQLERLSESATPFRFLATHQYGREPWANLMVHLPDIPVIEREPDCLYTENLVFEEWRSNRTGTRGSQRPGGRSWPKTHILKRTDTAYSLAKRYYGRQGAGRQGAQRITERNDLKRWGFDTPIVQSKQYKVGDKLTIPSPVDAGDLPAGIGTGILRGAKN